MLKGTRKKEKEREKKRERDLIIMTIYEADMITMMVVEGVRDRKTERQRSITNTCFAQEIYICSSWPYRVVKRIKNLEIRN